MHRSRWMRALIALAAVALLGAGCGDDDDEDVSSATTVEGDDDEIDVAGTSTVTIEMVDFGYEVSGPLATGTQTFETTNSGDEIHMMGIAKMKDGVTIEQVTETLNDSGEEGGAEEQPEEDASADDSAEGEEGGDLFEALFDGELGAPGHVIFPGTTQKVALEDDLDVGSYALICFIPSEGDGAPHFAKGMIGELTVVEEGGNTETPESDAAYVLPDQAEPDGPTTLEAGESTLKLTNDGEIGKDFIVGQVDGGDPKVFDAYFEEFFEGEEPPPVGAAAQAPGTIAGMVFEVSPGQTVYLTVDLAPGEWTLVSTNNVDSEDGEDADDYLLTVTVE